MKSNMKILLVFLCFILTASNSSANAADRVALVIGNSNYEVGPLKNPVNDAVDMKIVLEQVGFDVILKTNADFKTMLLAIDEFAEKLKHAQVGLFYYAGHGMQIDGNNFLIPIDTHVTSATDVRYTAVNAGRVLGKMEGVGNPMNIVILDACRDNPFKKSFRTTQKGLAKMDAPLGSIIAYATAPGSVAADGTGNNGVYTKYMKKNILLKGLTLMDVFMEVRKGVLKETEGKQVPWEESSLIGRFYFAGNSSDTTSWTTVEKDFPSNTSSSTTDPITTWTDSVTGIEFVWVPDGCFQIGQTRAEKKYLIEQSGHEDYNKNYKDELPRRKVCIDGFWMGKYEVTIEQFRKYLKDTANKSGVDWNNKDCPIKPDQSYSLSYNKFGSDDRQPMVEVSWNVVRSYSRWLSQKTGHIFKLPTEAQWEYAAKEGDKYRTYAGGEKPEPVAWYVDNSGGRTHKVGTKAPNGFGIHDLSGNVWEWCEDIYDANAYSKYVENNPVVLSGGLNRVCRSGSWFNAPGDVRASYRGRNPPDLTDNSLGFRLIREK